MSAEISYQGFESGVGTFANASGNTGAFAQTTVGAITGTKAYGESSLVDGDIAINSTAVPNDVCIQFSQPALVGGGGRSIIQPILRASDGNGTNCYVADINLATGALVIYEKTGSAYNPVTWTSGGTISPISSGNIGVKFQAQGTTFSLKVWALSGSEPGSFSGIATDSTHAAGKVGLRSAFGGGYSGQVATIDDFYVGDPGATFPGPTTGTVTGSASGTVGISETFTLNITGDGGGAKAWTGTPVLTLSGSASGTITQFSAFGAASSGTASILWTGAGTASVNATFPDSLAAGSAQAVTVSAGSSPAVSPTSATINQLATQTITASNFTGGSVTWSSSDTTVATVNSSGVVTARAKAGTATITATGVSNGAQTATCAVTVPAVSVSISPSPVTLAQGASQTFTATVTGTTNTAVTWSRSGAGTVDSSGHYTAPSADGSDTVTATSSADGTKSATASITISSVVTAAITSIWNAGPGYTGQTGTARVEWTDASGNEVQSATTNGIAERSGTGIYRANFGAAALGQTYIANWDMGAGSGVYYSEAVAAFPSKAGYALAANGLDSIAITDPGPVATHTTFARIIVATYRALWRKATQTNSVWTRYADDGITVNSTSSLSDDGVTQTIGTFT
jgi:hypothetical protein